MTEPQFTSIQYYARTQPGRPADDPAGILRVLRGPHALREQVMRRDGEWDDTEYFIRAEHHGEVDEGVVEITNDQAAVILHRWRSTGIIPTVEGVDLPPLPEGGPTNSAVATGNEPVRIDYYSFLSLPGHTRSNPGNVMRRLVLADGGTRDQIFSGAGEWKQTDYWIRLRSRGEADGEVVAISPQEAAVIIHGWYDRGLRPRVPGVEVPALPGAGQQSAP